MIDCYIKDFSKYVGQTVRIKGWVFNFRSSGKIAFLQIRDGSGRVQAVLSKNDVGEEIS